MVTTGGKIFRDIDGFNGETEIVLIVQAYKAGTFVQTSYEKFFAGVAVNISEQSKTVSTIKCGPCISSILNLSKMVLLSTILRLCTANM